MLNKVNGLQSSAKQQDLSSRFKDHLINIFISAVSKLGQLLKEPEAKVEKLPKKLKKS